jgi:hypothetical protein
VIIAAAADVNGFSWRILQASISNSRRGEILYCKLSSFSAVSTFIAQRIHNPMLGLSDRVVWFHCVPQ